MRQKHFLDLLSLKKEELSAVQNTKFMMEIANDNLKSSTSSLNDDFESNDRREQ